MAPPGEPPPRQIPRCSTDQQIWERERAFCNFLPAFVRVSIDYQGQKAQRAAPLVIRASAPGLNDQYKGGFIWTLPWKQIYATDNVSRRVKPRQIREPCCCIFRALHMVASRSGAQVTRVIGIVCTIISARGNAMLATLDHGCHACPQRTCDVYVLNAPEGSLHTSGRVPSHQSSPQQCEG